VRKADNLSPSCADVKKSRGLNLLESCEPVQACNGTALCLLVLVHSYTNAYRIALDRCFSNVSFTITIFRLNLHPSVPVFSFCSSSMLVNILRPVVIIRYYAGLPC
jgi:hypothetical protein